MNLDGEFYNIVKPLEMVIQKSNKFANGKLKFLLK